MKLGRYHQAAAEFHAARNVVPDYWQAYQAEARALEAAGQSAAAERVRDEIKK
jgi:Flp pilus assembly protein TadD